MRKAYLPRFFDEGYFNTEPPIPKASALGQALLTQPYALLSQQDDRDEWLKSRLHRVTGSALYRLLKRKNDSPETLSQRRRSYYRVMCGMPGSYEEGMPEKGSYARSMIEFGTNYEPSARVTCERLLDCDILEVGFWIDTQCRWFGASVDGVSADMQCIYEFKCRGPGNKPPHKQPMPYHYDQMQWNMAVMQVPMCHFLSFSNTGFTHETVLADPIRQQELRDEAMEVVKDYRGWLRLQGMDDPVESLGQA